MSGTTDQVIDDTIGELIADFQGEWATIDWHDDEAVFTRLEGMVDRLVGIRTQLRNGRGDDWMGLADPVENLALAGYRADAVLNKQMTPPNWDFVDQAIKDSWRSWAVQIAAEQM